jgi:hypothetical protein
VLSDASKKEGGNFEAYPIENYGRISPIDNDKLNIKANLAVPARA